MNGRDDGLNLARGCLVGLVLSILLWGAGFALAWLITR